jgi:hypothetical protein
VSCLDALVSQPKRDDGDIDTGLEQVHRSRMSNQVGRYTLAPQAGLADSGGRRCLFYFSR